MVSKAAMSCTYPLLLIEPLFLVDLEFPSQLSQHSSVSFASSDLSYNGTCYQDVPLHSLGEQLTCLSGSQGHIWSPMTVVMSGGLEVCPLGIPQPPCSVSRAPSCLRECNPLSPILVELLEKRGLVPTEPGLSKSSEAQTLQEIPASSVATGPGEVQRPQAESLQEMGSLLPSVTWEGGLGA